MERTHPRHLKTGRQLFHLEHCRYERARYLTKQLFKSDAPVELEVPECRCPVQGHGSASETPGQIATLSLKTVELYEKMESSTRVDRPQSMFSSNSTASEVMLPGDTPEAPTIKIFCKHSNHQKQELEGAMMAAKFYPYVQLPRLAKSGELLCPYSEGLTESELRFSFIRGGASNANTAETILYAELVRAEDTIRAYSKCLLDPAKYVAKPIARFPIHRFFHDRLVENTRLRDSYGGYFPMNGKHMYYEDFFVTPWKINGVTYPSLNAIFRRAVNTLHPSSTQITSCPVVFGLGDGQGSNVMIERNPSPNGIRKIMYIDYEVAGFHSLMLDLAKPFYNDVMFVTRYMDHLPEMREEIKYELSEGHMNVHFTPHIDPLSQAIFDIKIRYLLQPVIDIVRSTGGDLERNVPLLAHALITCATFARKYGQNRDVFMRNVATGIVLSQARNFEEFYAGFRMLGFKI